MWLNCLMVDLFKKTLLPTQTIDYWWSARAQNKVFCCLLVDTSSTTRQCRMSTPSLSGLSLSLKSLDLWQANIHNCLTCATLPCKGKEQSLLTFQVSSYRRRLCFQTSYFTHRTGIFPKSEKRFYLWRKSLTFEIKSGCVFSFKLQYIGGFGLVEMAISTNPKPTIYRNLYENGDWHINSKTWSVSAHWSLILSHTVPNNVVL